MCTPVIPALGKWRQMDQEFKIILCYTEFEAHFEYIGSFQASLPT